MESVDRHGYLYFEVEVSACRLTTTRSRSSVVRDSILGGDRGVARLSVTIVRQMSGSISPYLSASLPCDVDVNRRTSTSIEVELLRLIVLFNSRSKALGLLELEVVPDIPKAFHEVIFCNTKFEVLCVDNLFEEVASKYYFLKNVE